MERFRSWLHSSGNILKDHIRILIPILIGWYVWLARNDAKNKGIRIRSESIILKIRNHIFLNHQAKSFSRDFWKGDLSIAASWNISFPPAKVIRTKLVRWSKPPRQWVKVNTDGALNTRQQVASSGGVVRDEDGRILKGFQAYIGPASVIYAELVGIWHGLKVSKELRKDNVIVETDSMVAIQLIHKKVLSWHWKLTNILSKIVDLCSNRNIIFSTHL